MNEILGFHNEYEFMSNFVPAPVKLDDDWYPTTEHAYQAAKTSNPEQRRLIRIAKTPGIAKRLGQKVTKHEDWEEIKEGVMMHLLQQKFAIKHFKELLLATGDAYLEETNTWKDTYWGVYNGVGKNRLGHLLMELRAALKFNVEAW